jgi:TetR/AcrR family transcriptional regulator, transcriptional repressor of bet genes
MSRVTIVEGVVETARGTRRTPADKYDERRTQLAVSALATLGELGYAKTSLREIAQNSEFSHGVVHYYFADKVELITFCVRRYKTTCVQRYDGVVGSAGTSDELADGFADALVATLRAEASMHRLWYDLRSQALFEGSFRANVLEIDATLEQMVWRVVSRYAELTGVPPGVSSAMSYAMFDGLFQQALLQHLAGNPEAGPQLRERARDLLPRLL